MAADTLREALRAHRSLQDYIEEVRLRTRVVDKKSDLYLKLLQEFDRTQEARFESLDAIAALCLPDEELPRNKGRLPWASFTRYNPFTEKHEAGVVYSGELKQRSQGVIVIVGLYESSGEAEAAAYKLSRHYDVRMERWPPLR